MHSFISFYILISHLRENFIETAESHIYFTLFAFMLAMWQNHGTVIIETKKLAFIQFNIIIVCILWGSVVAQSRILLPSRRPSFNAWVGKIPRRRKWPLTPVFLPAESHGQEAWQAIVQGIAKSHLSDQTAAHVCTHIYIYFWIYPSMYILKP